MKRRDILLLIVAVAALAFLYLTRPVAAMPVPTASSVAGEPIPAPRQTDGAVSQAAAPSVSGTATWYDWHAGQAAAGPALRKALGAHWRGSTVKVCASRCVVVTLTDWCQCGHGRVIDLDDRAFARLAPLSQGVVRVTVSVVGQIDVPSTSRPTAPPTDVQP